MLPPGQHHVTVTWARAREQNEERNNRQHHVADFIELSVVSDAGAHGHFQVVSVQSAAPNRVLRDLAILEQFEIIAGRTFATEWEMAEALPGLRFLATIDYKPDANGAVPPSALAAAAPIPEAADAHG